MHNELKIERLKKRIFILRTQQFAEENNDYLGFMIYFLKKLLKAEEELLFSSEFLNK